MFHQEKPELLNVTYSLPPDGTYPPRLLVLHARFAYLSQSVWLRDGDSIVLEQNIISFRCDGNKCKVTSLNPSTSAVKVNGEALSGEQTLFDGDFIQWASDTRAIFQSDPVKDRRLFLQKPDSQLPNPLITPSLFKQVVMNADGISFNGGKDFAQWDEIHYLQVMNDPQTHLKVAIQRVRKGVGKELPLKNVSRVELQPLIEWLYIAIPFDLSVYEFGIKGGVVQLLPDAYFAAAHEKLLIPYQNGQRNLPADLNFIFGVQTRLQRWRDALFMIGGLLTVGGGIVIVFQFILPTLVGKDRANIIFIAAIGLFFTAMILSRIRQWWMSRERSDSFSG